MRLIKKLVVIINIDPFIDRYIGFPRHETCDHMVFGVIVLSKKNI